MHIIRDCLLALTIRMTSNGKQEKVYKYITTQEVRSGFPVRICAVVDMSVNAEHLVVACAEQKVHRGRQMIHLGSGV
jgi:hypothetical protein